MVVPQHACITSTLLTLSWCTALYRNLNLTIKLTPTGIIILIVAIRSRKVTRVRDNNISSSIYHAAGRLAPLTVLTVRCRKNSPVAARERLLRATYRHVHLCASLVGHDDDDDDVLA